MDWITTMFWSLHDMKHSKFKDSLPSINAWWRYMKKVELLVLFLDYIYFKCIVVVIRIYSYVLFILEFFLLRSSI